MHHAAQGAVGQVKRTPKQRVQRVLRHAYCRAFCRFDLPNGYTVWTGYAVSKGSRLTRASVTPHRRAKRGSWPIGSSLRCAPLMRCPEVSSLLH